MASDRPPELAETTDGCRARPHVRREPTERLDSRLIADLRTRPRGLEADSAVGMPVRMREKLAADRRIPEEGNRRGRAVRVARVRRARIGQMRAQALVTLDAIEGVRAQRAPQRQAVRRVEDRDRHEAGRERTGGRLEHGGSVVTSLRERREDRRPHEVVRREAGAHRPHEPLVVLGASVHRENLEREEQVAGVRIVAVRGRLALPALVSTIEERPHRRQCLAPKLVRRLLVRYGLERGERVEEGPPERSAR